ncbi:MAG: site-specific integrase [Eubacteriales bacterium]|nr:site-specific integrase [Eubacteriales bacterium]
MNNYPNTDVWRITDKDCDSQTYRYEFKFDFTFFESNEIKAIVKEYIWTNYRTGSRVPKGLRETLWRFKYFDAFCRQNDIQSLRELDNGLADDYRSFLHTCVSNGTGKTLSYSFQSNCFSAVRTIIEWCRVFLPAAVPEKQIFTGGEYRQINNRLKINFIPDEILQEINKALKSEDNPYLKYGLIILECTGMRVGDLLLLKTDCISEHPLSGYTISWFDHKNRKSRDNMPVPQECKEAVDCLLRFTVNLRKQADDYEKEHLFIYEPKNGTNKKPIINMSKQVFVKWCRDFSEKHGICDSGGNIFRLTSHMFRRTLATDMLSKGTNLKVIQEVLGHVSPVTTKKYYADVKNTDRADMFSQIGILGNIRQVSEADITEKTDLQWFQNNCMGKARLADGYCTLPVQDGKPCGHFLNRQKCYLCGRYITTLDDLEAHRQHLAELKEMLDSNIYGAHFAAHITPTTFALKEIIRRLEELQNEQ